MKAAFALATFLGAALIFLVEPMLGKVLLPRLGGGPAVWNTCMVFFQTALLAGYATAHLIGKLPRIKVQVIAFTTLALLAFVLRPRAGSPALAGVDTAQPLLSTGVFLAREIGLPFVTLAAAGPLLQRWFAAARGPNPYRLYAVSNAGSMVGLLAYPFVVERQFTLADQFFFWGLIFAGFAVAALLAGGLAGKAEKATAVDTAEEPAGPDCEADTDPITPLRRLRWLALSAVPSSLLLGATTHISSDIAAVPLLWIPPLVLYLGTFIVAFSGWSARATQVCRIALPIVAIAAGALAVSDYRSTIWPIVAVHLGLLAIAATACHGVLYALRPSGSRVRTHLTGYYLTIALGGVIGGCWNTLVAPVVFTNIIEYPIAIVGALLLASPSTPWLRGRLVRIVADAAPGLLAVGSFVVVVSFFPGLDSSVRWTLAWALPTAFGLCFAWVRFGTAVLVASMFAMPLVFPQVGPQARLVFAERSFFGLHRVYRTGEAASTSHELWHGRIVHGKQFVYPPLSTTTTSYYFRGGPISEVFMEFYLRSEPSLDGSPPLPKLSRAAFVGLGTGTLASFARSGMSVDFYEIDPAVKRIATDPALFTYVSKARVKPTFVMGDARVTLAARAEASPPAPLYDLVLIDAFSGDSIPVHLLTREAVELYFKSMTPDGLLTLHISNIYLDLEPVLAAVAKDLGLTAIIRRDHELSQVQAQLGKVGSVVMVLARSERALGGLPARDGWHPAQERPGLRTWTDDFSDLLSVFR